MHSTRDIYRLILARTAARYLNVGPSGIQITTNSPPLTTLRAHILDHGAARTLYQQRKPACRSLDGVRSLQDPQLHCAQCVQRSICTPQIRVTLVYDHLPYRLLLAFTSAKNFLFYCTKLRTQHRELADVLTQIRVLNRGTWGELRFDIATCSDERPEP